MTDRTHPDSGRTTGGIVEMLHARIVELEAQLSAIGAGGVSGPLMGHPQAMPDLTALTERGAKAWTGVDAQGLRDGVASAGSEPVAWTTGLNWRTDTRCQSEMVVKLTRKSQPEYGFTQPLYTHPSHPEGMVGGWRPIEAAPKDGTRILLHPAVEVHDSWSKGHWSEQQECWLVGGSASGVTHTYWLPLPPAPKASQQAAPSTDQVEEILRERDDAEDFIDALLDEVLGHERPEWSSAYGRADALNDVQERMTALHKPAVDKAWDQFQSAMEAPQQPAPSAAAAVNPDPHAELRKTWQPGQRWQARSFRNGQWGPWTDAVASEPFWFPHQDYRRHPDDLAPQPSPTPRAPFQQCVQPWLLECFGAEIAADRMERNHRFLEESLELVQSLGCTASEAHQLVDYVFGRPVGDPPQEVGGVMVTLAALCLASGLDMHDAGEVELTRISAPEVVAKIRAKQAAKPKHSPLPQSPTPHADELPIPADYGGEPRLGCGLEGAHPKIEWIANTAYAMRNMHTLDSTWRGQLITMAAAANFVAKQIAALEPTPQADGTPVAICNACGAELLEVKQSPNSYLSAEQFDADKLGDWYCKCCPKGPSECSSTHRYFWNRDLGAAAPQADGQPAADEDIAMSRTQDLAESGRWPSDWVEAYRRGYSDRAARAPADSGAAPAAYSGNIEQELAMLIRRIVSSARRNCEDGSNVLKLANEAWAYLVRKGLNGSPLRDAGIESDPTPPAQAADSVLEDAARLAKITQAIRDYHFALDCREHGGVAMARAWNAICDVLNMDWVQGAESAARKQGANHD